MGRRHFSLLRGAEGIRAHQRVQRDRGADYQAEMSIRTDWEGGLELHGRIDGVESTPEGPCLEEIKTTRDPENLPLDHGVHRLQAWIYAWMWLRKTGVCPLLRLRYVHPDPQMPERVMEWREAPERLESELEEVLNRYRAYLRGREEWIEGRNRSLDALEFPHSDLRPGQAELMREVGEVMERGGRLYAQAPTGIGKTLGVVFPALKAMASGACDTLMISTSRNSGKRVFEEAFRLLGKHGARVHALTLVAKDRICRNTGTPCDCGVCPLAVGFYDRLPAAMEELRGHDLWDTVTWVAVAERHGVCPYAFLMCAAREADVIIGDLNYALDPTARLEFLFGEAPERVGLLMDEAHHLSERGRAMLSAGLDTGMLARALKLLPGREFPEVCAGLRKVQRALRTYQRTALNADGLPEEDAPPPDAPARACREASETIEMSLGAVAPFEGDPRQDVLYMLRAFWLSCDRRQESHVCYREGSELRHFCRDVADWLREKLNELHACVLFSATLHPMEVFRRLTGSEPENRQLIIESPFHPDQFPIRLEKSIPMVWRARTADLYDRLTRRIQEEITAKGGKVLVFFPSYQVMGEVASRLPEHDLWTGPVQSQPRGLQEEGADAFLRAFRHQRGPVTGLAVLGGALNEGIDLPGDALTSVIVVSIGLPAVCRERELLRDWHQRRGEDGFVLAYTVPGLARVLQALGRVIRGPGDQGSALLIDPRFDHPFYRRYIPIRDE